MFQTTWKEINPVVTYANVLQCEPEFSWGPRIIREHQFIYVVKGKGCAQIQNRSYEAKEGDLFYYGPKVVHIFQSDARDPFQVYGMHFILNGMLPDAGEVPPVIQSVPADYAPEHENRLIIEGEGTGRFEVPEYCNPDTKAVEELFVQITRYYNKADGTSPIMMRALLIQFLLALKQNSDPKRSLLPNQDPSVLFVKSQLDLRAELPYSRSWLKEWTQYNEDYVARNFRVHFGFSPHEYHQELKILKAKELLAFTDLPVTEVAERLYFCTVHYFSRRFKMKTGYSPSDYRRLRRMI